MAEFLHSESSEIQSSSAEVQSSAVAESAVASSSVSNDVDTSHMPLEKRTKVTDVDSRTRDLEITEKDGTKIKVQITSPSLRDAETIDAKRSVVVEEDGETSIVLTPAKFHEALFKMFNNNSLLINDKVTDDVIGWDFFEKHEKETYHWFMDQAETFLTD